MIGRYLLRKSIINPPLKSERNPPPKSPFDIQMYIPSVHLSLPIFYIDPCQYSLHFVPFL